jgi:hypothetical protein
MRSHFIYLAVWIPLFCQGQDSKESTVHDVKSRPLRTGQDTINVVGQRGEHINVTDDSHSRGRNLALVTGIWIPTGALTQVGAHPEFGFQVGGKRNGFEIDFSMIFKFGDSPNYYPAMIMDSPGFTRHFFGGYVGVDFRKDFFHRGANEMSFLGGVGLDGWDVAKGNIRTKSVLTYNVNLGLGARHYFNEHAYIGLNLKYNFADYTLGHVVDFTGNPVTVHLMFGGLSSRR